MRRVLLTGGAGFIGRRLAATLIANGWSVRALDNLDPQVHDDPERSAEAFPGELVFGDVRDATAVSRAARSCDAVVHLAAATGVGQSMYQPGYYHETNVVGSANVASAAAEERAPFVFFSSRAVYGEGAYTCTGCGVTYGSGCCERAVPIASRESDPLHATSVYGKTKVQAEAIVQEHWHEDVPVLVLRPQNIVGAGYALANPYTGVLAAFAARLQAGLPMQIFGTGAQTRDIVHVADLVDLVSWALEDHAVWRDSLVLNVGTGVRTTLNELARVTARVAGAKSARIEHVDVQRQGDIAHACADMTTAKRHGAPIPRRSVDAAVGELIDWALRQPTSPPSLWDRALDELANEGLLHRGGA